MRGKKKGLRERVLEAIQEDDYVGFCLDCGAENYQCEPDMEEGRCESCGADRVYGAQQILLMGLVQ